MADHLDNGLVAAIKALDDVVAKSIDPANPLAREQLGLVSRYLGFVRQRLPLQFERDRFELAHYLALAQQLAPLANGCAIAGAPSLEDAARHGQAALSDPRPTSAGMRAAIDRLTTAISVLARSAGDAPPELRGPVERAIARASARLFDMQRAWYLPMGFEPDPRLVPPLAQALQAPPV